MNRLPLFVLLSAGLVALTLPAASQSLACDTVRARDERGKSLKDLTQSDFVVSESGIERPIERWSKIVGWFGGVKYEVCFSPIEEQTSAKTDVISIKRPRATATWTRKKSS